MKSSQVITAIIVQIIPELLVQNIPYTSQPLSPCLLQFELYFTPYQLYQTQLVVNANGHEAQSGQHRLHFASWFHSLYCKLIEAFCKPTVLSKTYRVTQSMSNLAVFELFFWNRSIHGLGLQVYDWWGQIRSSSRWISGC